MRRYNRADRRRYETPGRELVAKLEALADQAEAGIAETFSAVETARFEERVTAYRHAAQMAYGLLGLEAER